MSWKERHRGCPSGGSTHWTGSPGDGRPAPSPRTATAEARARIPEDSAALVRRLLEEHREDMVADLAAFTAQGSASDDLHALEACLTWLRAWLDRRLGAPESEEVLPHEDAGDILIRRYPARDAVTAGHARAHLDVRVATAAEQQRISRALAGLRPVDPRTRLEVTGYWDRPVFERGERIARLPELAKVCARRLGHDLAEAAVGGASDGNFLAAAGLPVLDGIGAVGHGAHARSESVSVSGMVGRSASAATILTALAEEWAGSGPCPEGGPTVDGRPPRIARATWSTTCPVNDLRCVGRSPRIPVPRPGQGCSGGRCQAWRGERRHY